MALLQMHPFVECLALFPCRERG